MLTSEQSDHPTSFFSLGIKAGMNSRFTAEGLGAHLDAIKERVLNKRGDHTYQKNDLIRVIQKKIAQNESEKTYLIKAREKIVGRIDTTEEAIDSHELIQTNDDIINYQDRSRLFLPYVIAVLFLLLLTVYLFLFYASTGFVLIYGVPESGSGVLNPEVFSFALNRGGSALLFTVLFPIVFLAVGFSVYATLAEQKESGGEGKRGSARLIAILLVTLVADFIIGYQLSKGIYFREYYEGLYQEEWAPSMVFSSIHFYLVLVMGFAIYLIWGFLLSHVIHHPYRETFGDDSFGYEKIELLENQHDRLFQKLQDTEKGIDKIVEQNERLSLQIEKITAGEFSKQWDSKMHLPLMNEFMEGYRVCLHNATASEESAKVLLSKVDKVYQSWLSTNKIDV